MPTSGNPDYSHISRFNEEAQFKKIVYADGVPTLSSEDKEEQDVQNYMRELMLKKILGNGFVNKGTITQNGDYLNIGEQLMNVNGDLVKTPAISLLITPKPVVSETLETVFVEIFYTEITKNDTLYKYGCKNSSTITNQLIDPFFGGETSKRIQICTRFRTAMEVVDITDVGAQGNALSPTVVKFTKDTTNGIYVASSPDFNTVGNKVYGLLVCGVLRNSAVDEIYDGRQNALIPGNLIDFQTDVSLGGTTKVASAELTKMLNDIKSQYNGLLTIPSLLTLGFSKQIRTYSIYDGVIPTNSPPGVSAKGLIIVTPVNETLKLSDIHWFDTVNNKTHYTTLNSVNSTISGWTSNSNIPQNGVNNADKVLVATNVDGGNKWSGNCNTHFPMPGPGVTIASYINSLINREIVSGSFFVYKPNSSDAPSTGGVASYTKSDVTIEGQTYPYTVITFVDMSGVFYVTLLEPSEVSITRWYSSASYDDLYTNELIRLMENKDIYIDSVNGNDTTGNGTNAKPYATLNKAVNEISGYKNMFKYNITINLLPGTYNTSGISFERFKNGKITVKGGVNKTAAVNYILDGGLTFRNCDNILLKGVEVRGNLYVEFCKFARIEESINIYVNNIISGITIESSTVVMSFCEMSNKNKGIDAIGSSIIYMKYVSGTGNTNGIMLGRDGTACLAFLTETTITGTYPINNAGGSAYVVTPNGGTRLLTEKDLVDYDLTKLQSHLSIYVATTGNDTYGDGTSGKPYGTIQRAINSIPKNLNGNTATVNVMSGTYVGYKVNGFRNGVIKVLGASAKEQTQNFIITTLVQINDNSVQDCQVVGFTFKDEVYVIGSSNVTLLYNIMNNTNKTKDGITISGGSNVSIQLSTISNRRNGIVLAYSSLASIYSLDGTGNDIGINNGTSSGSSGIVILSNCTITGTTPYATNYGGIIIKDGIPINSVPINHASADVTYGLGTGAAYGHVSIYNYLDKPSYVDGQALSAYMGKVLNDSKAPKHQSGTTVPSAFVGEGVLYGVYS